MNNLHHIERLGIELIKQMKKDDMDISFDFLSFGIATEFLRAIMGNDWVNETAFSQHSEVSHFNREARKYFKTEETSIPERYKHQHRIISLANKIIELSNIKGFPSKFKKISKGGLESISAELECASQLHRSGLNISFIEETGTRGSDFDILIQIDEDSTINCEIKAKIEGTSLSKNTILRSLNKSRKQLPKDNPAVIFLKIPEDWIFDQTIKTTLEETIIEFFRNTTRVISVIIRWDTSNEIQEGFLIATKFNVYLNKNISIQQSSIEALKRIEYHQSGFHTPITDISKKLIEQLYK